MAFGLSGAEGKAAMLGADVVIAYWDTRYQKEKYFLCFDPTLVLWDSPKFHRTASQYYVIILITILLNIASTGRILR